MYISWSDLIDVARFAIEIVTFVYILKTEKK